MRRRFSTLLALAGALCVPALFAQLTGNNIITTFAGAAWTFPNGVAARNAPIGPVIQAHLDNAGNVIFADPGNDVVSRINPDGTISIIAGNGIRGFSGDGGPARSASMDQPSDAVMDTAGNLYIFDGNNSRIRRVTPDGIMSTYAGTGVPGFAGDGGPAIDAGLGGGDVSRLAVDATGRLYISSGATIRRISNTGIISTFAGNRGPGQGGENVNASQTPIDPPSGAMVFDAAGNLYFAETGGNRIRKITPAGIITTVAGAGPPGFRDGPAATARFSLPRGLAIDATGNLYVGDGDRIRKISAGVVTTIAGNGTFDSSGDGGPAVSATFRFAQGLVVDRRGNLYIAEYGSSKIRVISPDGIINTAAGNGQFRNSPDGTPAQSAYLFLPWSIAFDPSGNLLIPDPFTGRLRRVRPDGTIQVVAGVGAHGGSTTGPALRQSIGGLRSAVGDTKGNIYWSDTDFNRVMRVSPDGQLTVFVDNDVLKQPQGLALDAAGNLYVADSDANVIRKVTPAGVISTIAGTGVRGFAGENVPATQARLANPQALAFDPGGNLIVADAGNNRLRKITPAGVISVIAGNGQTGPPVVGSPALQTGMTGPSDLAIDTLGNIYFLLSIPSNVWLLSTSGTISTVAGSGKRGFSGDGGPAKGAAINVDGLALDAQGNLYLADVGASRIRVILATPPAVSLSAESLSFEAYSTGAGSDTEVLKVTSALAGYLYNVRSNQPWLKTPAGIASAPSSFEVAADPTGLNPGTYTGTVSIGPPNVSPVVTIAVKFTVLPALPPKLALDTKSLTLSGAVGGPVQTQSFLIQNAGGGTLNFALAASGSGLAAIALDTQSGSVQPTSGAPVRVSLDPDALPVGTYQASIAVSSSTTSETVNIPITISIAPRPQRMALPQRGLLFTAVKGGGVTPAQPIQVLNVGQGSFTWQAQASIFSGESGWLSVSPDSGSSNAASVSGQVTVRVDHSLVSAPGIFYGLVRVTADGASNSPQDVQVVLNLLPANQNPGAVVGPSGLVFTASATGGSPGSQTFDITNLSASEARFALTTLTLDLGPWLRAAPDHGVIPAGGSQTITVQSNVAELPAGVYDAQVAVQVEDTPRNVRVLLVIAPGPLSASDAGRAAAGCTPTRLIPVFTSFLQDFTVPAAWPIPLEVRAVDDCGTPQGAGRSVTTFSNGDPPLALISLKDGRWQGTWFGENLRAAKIAVTDTAAQDSPQIHGSLTATGTLQANNGVPFVTPGAVTNAAPALPQAPLAPGSLISIGGKDFAFGQVAASQLPLDITLGGTQVILAGRSLPLIYSSGGLINAIVPYDIDPDSLYSLLVERGTAVSGPETVAVAVAQPAVFKVSAAADLQVVQDFWTQILSGGAVDAASAAPGAPVQAGASLTVYCTGLGALDAALDAAQPAPSTPPNVKNPVSVTIGGSNAAVSSATLVPGYTGLYQVKITMPSGLSAGNGIPLVVSVLGKSSVPVNLSVR